MMAIPEAELRLESHALNPPKPVCFHVYVEGKSIAIVSLEEFSKAQAKLQMAEERRGVIDDRATAERARIAEEYRNPSDDLITVVSGALDPSVYAATRKKAVSNKAAAVLRALAARLSAA